MCGEKCGGVLVCNAQGGSPPRMRGREYRTYNVSSLIGITPAYAGKSGLLPGLAACTAGSPPRMRGKDAPCTAQACLERITPAYAGKSNGFITHNRMEWDHPRVCGEKRSIAVGELTFTGSPPRMRGKAPPTHRRRSRRRITPAYAGKSRTSMRLFQIVMGSPPRMRGKAVR